MTAPDLVARLNHIAAVLDEEPGTRETCATLYAVAAALDAAARDTELADAVSFREGQRALWPQLEAAQRDTARLDKAERLLAVGGNIYGDSASPEDGTPSSVTLAPEGTDDVPAPTLRAALDAWQGEAK
jgi:hypothetical protein